MVAQGEGVAGNSTAARHHFQQAAEAGFAAGLLNMAMLELYGWDGTANCTAALKYMRVRSMQAAPSLGYPHTPCCRSPPPPVPSFFAWPPSTATGRSTTTAKDVLSTRHACTRSWHSSVGRAHRYTAAAAAGCERLAGRFGDMPCVACSLAGQHRVPARPRPRPARLWWLVAPSSGEPHR